MKDIKIVLPEELSIYNIENFWRQLVNHLEDLDNMSVTTMTLDFSSVGHIDGAGIQLLLSLEKTILKEKLSVRYLNVEESIKETLKSTGLEYLLVSEEAYHE